MSSPQGFARKSLAGAGVMVVLLLLAAGEMSAQSEKRLTEEAAVKIKLKKYADAAAILKRARGKYPSSVKVAELTMQLCEKAKAGTDELIDAYEKLIKVLQLKELTEGKLSSKERRFFKKAKKRLADLLKVRGEVDAAVKEFVSENIKTCMMFARLEKFTEASFVFQRLSAFKTDEESERELKKLAGELKNKAWLLKRPTGGLGAQDDERILRARRLFKLGRFDKARIECLAALEKNPNLPGARAMLCDIADKTGDTAQMLLQGLSYLLFPPRAQSVKRAEEIEKRILKASPDLRAFFDSTAKAADKIYRGAKKALKGKKNSDLDYAMGQLACLTHRTKKVEPLLEKVESIRRGTRIFDGRNLTGWMAFGRSRATASDGCITFEFIPNQTNRIFYHKINTSESFTLKFSFQIERRDPKAIDAGDSAAIIVPIWGDGDPSVSSGRSITVTIHNNMRGRASELSRWSNQSGDWDRIANGSFTAPLFEPGRWYTMRFEYIHSRLDTCKIIITVNGQPAGQIFVPDDFFPERTGYVGLGHQDYNWVKFKDIYLVP